MQELIARLGVIFSQLGDQVRAAVENADTGAALGAAIDVILPVACGILRVVAVIVAIVIIVRCLMSLFREKPGKEIWGGSPWEMGPVWTCAIGRTPLDGGDGRMSVWIFPPSPAAMRPCCGTTRGAGNSSPCRPRTEPGSTERKSPTPCR